MSFEYDPSLPITAELPVVKPEPPGRSFLKLLTALLLFAVAAGAAVVFFPRNDVADPPTPDDLVTATGDDGTGDPDDGTVDDLPDTEPEIVELPDESGAVLTVFDVSEFLNVRAGPGTANDVIATLERGEEVRTTGERVTVNDSEWKRVELGGGFGWVSGRYLTDEPVAAQTPVKTAVCLQGTTGGVTRTLRIEFGAGDAISGPMRIDDSSGARLRTIEGQLASGVASVVITDSAGNRRAEEDWTFRPADVVLGDSTGGAVVAVVPCTSVAALLR